MQRGSMYPTPEHEAAAQAIVEFFDDELSRRRRTSGQFLRTWQGDAR